MEINANILTEEENRLLCQLFRMGLGHAPNTLQYKGTISLSYNTMRTMTMEEESKQNEKELAELMKKAGEERI